MKFSPLVDRIKGESVAAWTTHTQAREAQLRGEDVIVLSIGDPVLETPAPVLERAIESLRAGDVRYAPAAGRLTLRKAIAEAHQRRSGQAVNAENVIFLSGAQNALFAASMCVAGPGDEVLALEPLYPSYPATIRASGAQLVRVAARTAAGFRPDLAALEAAITARTRALFFATPNNPSGVILNPQDLAVIGELARRHSLWIVADEVYAGLAPGGRVPGLAARLPEQVVTVNSLSKSHSMPGLRAGWMVGPAGLVRHAESLSMCMLFGLPGFIQEAALAALQGSEAPELRIRELCSARRDMLLAGLAGVRGIRCCAPDAGMFTLIDVRETGLSGYDFMTRLFGSERVSVLDGGAFGEATRGFVRLCFATDEAALREAMLRIRRFAETLARRT
ncbi:MAG TPA: aminotransferase class I/II-fold pyridoxal phosphate-dependent enzyme [Steroidobacteraceae bacterium]|jgi:aspartate/methionine/tyrosine aminotransferase|nr:aminotransferase class I/II-fold pyridoxal phosphate-dependent enzyme [Steroidobacteraceae bacterium]